MILRPLGLSDEVQALQGHAELAKENWEYLLGYKNEMSWPEYLEILDDESKGINLKEGRVPATFLIAEHDGSLIGRTSIRHELNDFLFNFGGHIGYGVRPSYRRRGFATKILSRSLSYIHGLGVTKVLVTCDEDNVGSMKVIESQGGVLENTVEFEGIMRRRYWITNASGL
jgi:predicted acetyltransferase